MRGDTIKRLGVVTLAFASACRSGEGAPPAPPLVASVAPLASAAPPPTATADASEPAARGAVSKSPAPAEGEAWRPGLGVTARGRVSKTPWQHLVGHVPGKMSAYFDLEGKKEQTIVYWKDAPKCAGAIEVDGTVIEVRGGGKAAGRTGAPETKADESFRELHLDVASARCVE